MKLLRALFLASLLFGQIGGISPVSGVVVYAHDIVLAVLVAVSFVKILHDRKFPHLKLMPQTGLVIAAGLISLIVNYWRFPPQSLVAGSLYLVRWSFYSLLYVLVIDDGANLRFWVRGLYIVGVGFGILGLMQFFLYPDLRNLMYLGWDPHYYRLFTTLLDPNFAGIIFVLTLIAGFCLWKEKNNNFLLLFGQVISFISLLLTYSRSSYIALGAAIVYLAISKKQWKLIAVLFVFTGILFILPRTSGTLDLLRSDSTLARIGNWREGIALIAQTPLFGYGFDMLRYVRPAGNLISKSASGLDSSILFIAATTGIVGLFAYAFLIVSMIRAAAGPMRPVLVASIVAILVHSLFVNSLFYPWVMVWLWILAGVATYDR